MTFDWGKYKPEPQERKTPKSAFLRKLEKQQRKPRAEVVQIKSAKRKVIERK